MLNRDISINEIITKYPKVQEFLLLNEVDCMKCSVKTCLLKDILEYHNFSKEDQVLMYEHMDKLAEGSTSEMLKFSANENPKEFSLLVEALISEHTYIKELIYIMNYISSKDNFLVKYSKDIDTVTNYLSEYADQFHHQKEEDLLFGLFRGKEIVEAMYEEHDIGRNLRKNILESTTDENAKKYILEFVEMLSNHIYKEDNVLFPYLDKLLSEEEKEELGKKLNDYDTSLEQEVIDYISEFNKREFNL